MFVTTEGQRAVRSPPRFRSGSGSAKLSKLFNLQLFVKSCPYEWSGASFLICLELSKFEPFRIRAVLVRHEQRAQARVRVAVRLDPLSLVASLPVWWQRDGESSRRDSGHSGQASCRRCDAGGARCAWRSPTPRSDDRDDTSSPTNKSREPNKVSAHEQIITWYEITSAVWLWWLIAQVRSTRRMIRNQP